MIDISDRDELLASLSRLAKDELPRFGIMTPQHMVEHLAFSLQFSNGRLPQKRYVTAERAQAIKDFILGDDQHPIGVKAPMLGDGLVPLITPTLLAAIDYLAQELAIFDRYFSDHPTSTPMNPMLGELTHSEWLRFHSKHFSHHFKQFGLLGD